MELDSPRWSGPHRRLPKGSRNMITVAMIAGAVMIAIVIVFSLRY